MDKLIAIINDMIVVFFDLLICMKLTVLKKNTIGSRVLMYSGCTMILIAYFTSTYIFEVTSSISSFLCMALPSFIFFYILSEYKDARFFVTFCFVDTVTLIIAFFGRSIGILAGVIGGMIACICTFLLFLLIYSKGREYFPRYRNLFKSVQSGWNVTMLATCLIYFLMIFAAAYPKPLAQRPEYLPVYALLSLTVLSFYTVFLMMLTHKKKLFDLNIQFELEKKWHKIAYVDVLTGMKNRMAYVERINELERTAKETDVIYAVMMDIDNFKQINDTLGHHIGDFTLEKAAEFLNEIFAEESYEVFRIGGDEFAVVAVGASREELEEKIHYINKPDPEVGCSFSVGFSPVNLTQNNFMENAFIRADRAMYDVKKTKKHYARS